MQDIFSKIEWRKTWKLGSSHDAPELTERSILVAVMGMTGAGKTTFINEVTGANMEIGHGLKSCTHIIGKTLLVLRNSLTFP